MNSEPTFSAYFRNLSEEKHSSVLPAYSPFVAGFTGASLLSVLSSYIIFYLIILFTFISKIKVIFFFFLAFPQLLNLLHLRSPWHHHSHLYLQPAVALAEPGQMVWWP